MTNKVRRSMIDCRCRQSRDPMKTFFYIGYRGALFGFWMRRQFMMGMIIDVTNLDATQDVVL